MKKLFTLSVLLAPAAATALVACSSSSGSGSGSGTTARVGGATSIAAAPTTDAGSTPVSGLGGGACTKLKTLRDLDYAFGKSFIAIQPLDDSSKRQTVSDIQNFQSSAPSELSSAVTALLAFWQKFETDANSVDEAGYTSAGQPFADYLTAHCS